MLRICPVALAVAADAGVAADRLEVAAAMRCVPQPEADVRERLRHVIGTLVRLTR